MFERTERAPDPAGEPPDPRSRLAAASDVLGDAELEPLGREELHAVAMARLARLFPEPRQPRQPVQVRQPPVPSAEERLWWALQLSPGADLVVALAAIDPTGLGDDDRVVLLQAWERASRWVAVRQCDAVVAVAGGRPADRDDFVREHVRLALLGCGGSPKHSVDVARALAGPLFRLRAAMEGGDLSYDHARVVVQETATLDPFTTIDVVERVLLELDRRAQGRVDRARIAAQRTEDRDAAAAGREPMPVPSEQPNVAEVAGTPGRFRSQVRAAVIAADPLRAELAAQEATAARAVSREALPDAQAMLRVTGPAIGVATIWTALDLRAAQASADDPRTLDQRRFDALVALCTDSISGAELTGAARRADGEANDRRPKEAGDDDSRRAGQVRRGPGTRRGLVPGVYVFADAATWAGLADGPVELDGYGPIPAGVAREHFESSTWRVMVTDTLTGASLAVSDGTYRPSARTRRHLHARDRCCAFPGCHAAIWFCDADHSTPHAAGGCTDTDNCGLLCRRHHRLKTHGRWRWRRTDDCTITWTDPNGRRWHRHGPSYDLPPPWPEEFEPWAATGPPEPAPAEPPPIPAARDDLPPPF